jgi:catechol 2,3-dioxygenase-like lactoylglutathione lyase family enzyme
MTHVVFIVPELKKSLAFYRDVLDFHIQMEEYDMFLSDASLKTGMTVSIAIVERADDVQGMVELAEFKPRMQDSVTERGYFDFGFWAMAMEVKNLDSLYQTWSERGVVFEVKPNVQTVGSQGQAYSAVMKDIDGNRIELIQRLD